MSQRPRKRFGQHFLHDRHVIERIVAAVSPRADDHLVEIGPGEGVLTAPLLACCGHLDVIEIDRDLAAALRRRNDWAGTLRVHEADALKFDFAALAGARLLRIVGNLPYNISTPLLFHLLDQRQSVADMHFMLQREVVDRLAAAPGNGSRGRLSVMVQAFCSVEPLFRVGAGAFRPPPAVESAVVRLVPRADPAVEPALQGIFADLVRLAFAGRRKTLRNTLASRLDAGTMQAAGIDPGERPQRLDVEDFATLARAVR